VKELEYPFDPALLLSQRKRLRRELTADGKKRIKKKIAILGGSTTNTFVKMFDLFLLDEGIECEFLESEYDRWWQDAVFGSEDLNAFAPDIVYIFTSWRNLERFFPQTGEKDGAAKHADECLAYFTKAWDALRERCHCVIIQNNTELPPYRLLGNRDCWDENGSTLFIGKMNLLFAQYAQTHGSFYINDLAYQAAAYGLEAWHDLQAWYMYKLAMKLEAYPSVAANAAHIVKSVFGKNKKAIALDLDNTLWGGVVGDDGVEGIQIGRETAASECFEEFQKYLKKLSKTGVMLTVASKNDRQNAIDGLNHPEGVLRPDDFIVIKANWDPKDRNIADTAHEMNIGTDAFVFVDDNPTERALVSRSVNGISVPELTTPETYIQTIDRSGFFEATEVTADDAGRNDMYKANAQRAQRQTEFTDYGEYLISLKMTAEIKPFNIIYIPRITQLTNKSNQFNLTTRRYTQQEIEQCSADKDTLTLYGKLTDIFGDNGVVAVVIAKKSGTNADIELWLMSCRVLKKDMEYAMLDTLVAHCIRQNVKTLTGYYCPTAKNAMVKELYCDFGFTKVSEDASGNTVWRLELDGYTKKNRYITVED